MYFNTTQKKGFQLLKANERTDSIKARLLILFKAFGTDPTHPGLTASDAHKLHRREFGSWSPIWSVRARITTLVHEGKLIKTTKQKIGPQGEPEHYYKLRKL